MKADTINDFCYSVNFADAVLVVIKFVIVFTHINLALAFFK